MSKLSTISISEIGVTITGKTPSSQFPEDFGNEFMFITPSDNFDSKYISTTQRFLSKNGLEKLKSKILPPNSVLVSCIGSAMGKVSMNTTVAVSNQQINSIIPNQQKFDNDYVYYQLKNNYQLLRTAASGSTAVPLLNKADFDSLKLNIHANKSDQRKIASVLSALDDKIEINNKINSELEAMAKTLYDYWFVQFDFLDANDKPYKSSGGKMVWNETLKRKIPEGWEVKTLASFINSDKSGDWGKEVKQGNYTVKVECVRGADINGINGKGDVKAPVRYILEKNTHKLLTANDLVVEISGGSPVQSTGRITCITKEVLSRFKNPLICSNFCKAVSLKDEDEVMYFLSAWNKAYNNNVLFGFEGKTSGIKNLLFENFINAYMIVKPTSKVIKDFNNKLSLFEKKRQQNLKQNQELAELRDWLLPMLMNGQLTVGETEEKMGMVAEGPMEYNTI